MYNANRFKRSRKNKQLIALLSVLTVILGLAGGITLAYIFTQTQPIENTFRPTEVTVEIEEEFDGSVKSEVKITNTGTAPSYIRAAVVVTWVTSDGSTLAETPVEGEDYDITYAENTGWLKGDDGYWYYTTPVNPNESTGILIDECTQLAEKNDCQLAVEILASAIQSDPSDAVTEAWGVTVSDSVISNQGV